MTVERINMGQLKTLVRDEVNKAIASVLNGTPHEDFEIDRAVGDSQVGIVDITVRFSDGKRMVVVQVNCKGLTVDFASEMLREIWDHVRQTVPSVRPYQDRAIWPGPFNRFVRLMFFPSPQVIARKRS